MKKNRAALHFLVVLSFSFTLFDSNIYAEAGNNEQEEISQIQKLLQTTHVIYIGKVKNVRSGGLFSNKEKIFATIEVIEYLSGGGKLALRERIIKGFFPDVILDQLYLVGQKDDLIVALIPLEDKNQYRDTIQKLLHQKVIRNIIIDATAAEVVNKLKVKWGKCRIYDSDNLPLIERKSTNIISQYVNVQFITGCAGKKIQPYIEMQSLVINDKQATITGIINSNKLRFTAELSDKNKGASFDIDKITFDKNN